LFFPLFFFLSFLLPPRLFRPRTKMYQLSEADQQVVSVKTPQGTLVRQTLCVGSLQTNATIIGNLDTKAALVIDPGDEADRILTAAKKLGLEVWKENKKKLLSKSQRELTEPAANLCLTCCQCVCRFEKSTTLMGTLIILLVPRTSRQKLKQRHSFTRLIT